MPQVTKRTKKFLPKLAGEIKRRKERQKWGKWKGTSKGSVEEEQQEQPEKEQLFDGMICEYSIFEFLLTLLQMNSKKMSKNEKQKRNLLRTKKNFYMKVFLTSSMTMTRNLMNKLDF
jgi:hypothetical protein